MTWFGTPLTDEQDDIVALVADWQDSLPTIADDEAHDEIDAVRAALAELGIWSIGVDETAGGGGADLPLRLTAFIALGARLPALVWSCAQAHAAAEVLLQVDSASTALGEVVTGARPVAVVDRLGTGVRFDADGDRVSGTAARIDPAGHDPVLVLLDGADTAWLLPPPAVEVVAPLRRTGLAGAHTAAIAFDGTATRVEGIDVAAIRSRLRLAGAAIAAGIAAEAATLALSYSAERIQFGGPLDALPTVRRSLATLRLLATESISTVLSSGEHSDRAALALSATTQRAITAGAGAVQALGGYGYVEEYSVGRLLRDAISLRAATDADHVGRAVGPSRSDRVI